MPVGNYKQQCYAFLVVKDFGSADKISTVFFSLLLRCYFHTNTLPNPRGCIFSPGFIFSIGTSWRKGQQGSAVFSGVSA